MTEKSQNKCQGALLHTNSCPAFPNLHCRGGALIKCSMLCSLHLLFDKNLDRALQVVDKGQVKCYVAQDSQRKLFVVRLWVSGFPEDVAPQRIRTLSRRPPPPLRPSMGSWS